MAGARGGSSRFCAGRETSGGGASRWYSEEPPRGGQRTQTRWCAGSGVLQTFACRRSSSWQCGDSCATHVAQRHGMHKRCSDAVSAGRLSRPPGTLRSMLSGASLASQSRVRCAQPSGARRLERLILGRVAEPSRAIWMAAALDALAPACKAKRHVSRSGAAMRDALLGARTSGAAMRLSERRPGALRARRLFCQAQHVGPHVGKRQRCAPPFPGSLRQRACASLLSRCGEWSNRARAGWF